MVCAVTWLRKGFLFLAVVAATMPRLVGSAYLNLASVYLFRGLSQSHVSFSYTAERAVYVTEEIGARELQRASTWAKAGSNVDGDHPRLLCVALRAAFGRMDWGEVVDSDSSCDDLSLRARAAPWAAVEGLRQLQRGRLSEARYSFRRSLVQGTGLLSLSLDPWLRQVRESDVDSQLAGTVLQADAPRFLVGRMVNYEWRPSPEPVSKDWMLVGYDLDERALELGEMVGMSIFWQPRNPGAQPEAGWLRVGDFWREDLRLVNLIPDAGFEWEAEGQPGWYGPSDATRIIRVERNGYMTYAKAIMANPTGGGTIVSTPIMPLGRDCAYLIGGWVRSEGGGPTLSVVWAGLEDKPDDRAFLNLMEGIRDLPWTHVSVLVTSPKSGARGVSVYASNWAGIRPEAMRLPALVVVDNIFLIPLSVPGAANPCAFYGLNNEQ